MLKSTLITLLLSTPFIVHAQGSEEARQNKQIELDNACEQARQVALGPRKLEVYQECMGKGKEEEYCLKEGDNYNGYRVNGSPLFYDLPECETAFKNRSTYRNAD